MEKMTILKMLERTVVTISKSDVKRIYLVSADGEVVEAKFLVGLIQKIAKWNFLWEVNVISVKFYDDYFTVFYDADIEQANGDPDKVQTWYGQDIFQPLYIYPFPFT